MEILNYLNLPERIENRTLKNLEIHQSQNNPTWIVWFFLLSRHELYRLLDNNYMTTHKITIMDSIILG